MTLIKKTLPQKKAPIIEVDIVAKQIEKISKPSKKDKEETPKIDLSNLFLDVDNKIQSNSAYRTDDGDLIMSATVDGRIYISIEQSEENLNKFLELSDTVTDDVEKTTRKARTVISDDMFELCEVKLGFFRSRIDKIPDIENILKGVRTYYDKITGEKLENDKAGNIDYRTMIVCTQENIELATNTLKNIFKKEDKLPVVEWFI